MVSEAADTAGALERLLSEPALAVAERESACAPLLSGDGPPMVLFGAGGLGRRTLAGLRRLGLEPVAFSDNDPALWGTDVDGVPVLSPRDSARYARDGVAVVTIWRAEGGHEFAITRSQLETFGWLRVEPFLPLYWAAPEQFLPYLAAGRPSDVLPAADEIRRAFALLGDEASRLEFVAQLRWRVLGDFSAVSEPTPGCDAANEYWPAGLVSCSASESFVDCGAFDGDTLCRYVHAFSSFSAWSAYEPDPVNVEVLERRVAALPSDLGRRVRVRAAATGAAAATAFFVADGTAAAHLSPTGAVSAIEVPVAALDEEDLPSAPSFVKLDVEGAEAATLRGASALLRAHRPTLAVSAYHRLPDLWELPLLVHELCPWARLELRAHAAEAFDLVLYALTSGESSGV